jgi:anti-sigma B factor antagonist
VGTGRTPDAGNDRAAAEEGFHPSAAPSSPPAQLEEINRGRRRTELSLAREEFGDHVVLRVGGEIDFHTAPRLYDYLVEQMERPSVVDMAGVSFCDSSGLGALVTAHKDYRTNHADLVLAAPRPNVARLLRLTQLDSVIGVFDTVEDALARGPVR